MDPRLKEIIRNAILQNCSWLEPVDDSLPVMCESRCAKITVMIPVPSLTLRVKRRRKGYFRNRIIRISERMLDDAIALLSSDAAFLNRLSSLSMTNRDVETIISAATYGTLKLDLFDF